MNSIETCFEATNPNDASVSAIRLDEEFTATRIAAYKTMFPDLDAVGWYSVKGTSGSDAQAD